MVGHEARMYRLKRLQPRICLLQMGRGAGRSCPLSCSAVPNGFDLASLAIIELKKIINTRQKASHSDLPRKGILVTMTLWAQLVGTNEKDGRDL